MHSVRRSFYRYPWTSLAASTLLHACHLPTSTPQNFPPPPPSRQAKVKMNVTSSGPFFDANENDQAAIVMIASLAALLVMIATVAPKVLVCRRASIPLNTWDYILYLGVVFTIIQTACVILAVESGLGKHLSAISSHEQEEIKRVRPSYYHIPSMTIIQKLVD